MTNQWDGFLPPGVLLMARAKSQTKKPSSFTLDDRPTVKNDSLQKIAKDLVNCKRCRLHKGRTNIVFGEGNPKADLVFVGEAPGEKEDESGKPFIGRAGKLLTKMIESIGLTREDVFICNVVKSRPPENRNPEDDEIQACSPFLFRQLDVIKPKVVVTLGKFAAQTLLQTDTPISQLRGEKFPYRGAKLIPTFHPAYLLRNPSAKKEVWIDLKTIAKEMGLKVPRPKKAEVSQPQQSL